MLIDVPKNYKCTCGKLTDPIRYLTGKDSAMEEIKKG